MSLKKLALLVILSLTALMPAYAAPAAPTTALFEKLGGLQGINHLVSEYIDRLLADESFKDLSELQEFQDPWSQLGLKMMVTSAVSESLVQPNAVKLPEHAQIHLTQTQWKSALKILDQTLSESKLPAAVQQELKQKIDQSKGKIINITGKT